MTDNKRYQFEQNIDNKTSSNFNNVSNQNFNNTGANFNLNEINNINLNNFNARASGYNQPIPKEIDDLFDESFAVANNEKQSVFDFNLKENNQIQSSRTVNEREFQFPLTENNTNNSKVALKNIENANAFNKFTLFDSTFNKTTNAISPNKDISLNQNNIISNKSEQQIKKDQIDFSGFEDWNFQSKDNKSGFNNNNHNNNNDIQSNSRNSIKNNNDIFNFDHSLQKPISDRPSKIQPNNVANSELKDTLKLKSRQDAYKEQNLIEDNLQSKPNKKSSALYQIDVNNLGKEYDNSSPVISKEVIKSDIYLADNKDTIINENRKVSVMDQNIGIDFDNILDQMELKDNTNSKDIYNQKNKKFPNENYDAYFNENNKGINKKQSNNENLFLNNDFYDQGQGNLSNIGSQTNFYHDNSRKLTSNSLGKQFKMTQAIEWDAAYGKSKSGKEKNEEISERKTRILNDDFLYVTRNERNFVIERSKSLKPIINYDEESLSIQIQDIFNEMLIKTENPERVKIDMQSVSLDESEYVSPIGFLFNVDRSLPNNISCKNEIKREIAGSRLILNDGNGFYRAFMFALLESRIISSDLYELKRLIFDMNTKLDRSMKLKDVKINKDKINLVFSFIVEALENNKIRESYDILIRAYLFYQEFDYAMIKYMRVAIAEFLEENKSQIFNIENQSNIAKIVTGIYTSKDTFNLKGYLDENILCMHYEVEKIVFLVAPIIFNVNLELYILEGIALPSIKEHKYFKKLYQCLKGSSNRLNNLSPTITLFYKFCRFETLYSNNYLMQNKMIISFSEFDTQIQFTNTKQRITILAEILCEVCNRQCQLLTISHMPGMSLCKLCLVDFIYKISTKRVRYLSGELFVNKEYYFRPILIDKESNYMLHDQDTLLLLGKTTPQIILSFLNSACLFCNGNNRTDKFHTLKCQCSICQICLEKELKSNTDSKLILNNFEKMYSNFKRTKCTCGAPFDSEYAATLINNRNTYAQEANDRLCKFAQTFCIICRTNVPEKTLRGDEVIRVYNRFAVEPQNDLNVANGPHIICNHCIITVKGDIMQMNRSGKLQQGSKTVPIKCSVCIGKTHQVELKNLKQYLKSEGGCCIII